MATDTDFMRSLGGFTAAAEQEKKYLEDSLAQAREGCSKLEADLNAIRAKLDESDRLLAEKGASLFGAYSYITLGATGFLGAAYATALILQSLLPQAISARLNFLERAAHAVQLAMISASLQRVVFGAGVCGGLIALFLILVRSERARMRTRGKIVLSGVSLICLVLPYYPFVGETSVGLLEGICVFSALACPMLAFFRLKSMHDLIEKSLRPSYVFSLWLVLLIVGAVFTATRFYALLLTVVLFAPILFVDLIESGAATLTSAAANARLRERAQDAEDELQAQQRSRGALLQELQRLPARHWEKRSAMEEQQQLSIKEKEAEEQRRMQAKEVEEQKRTQAKAVEEQRKAQAQQQQALADKEEERWQQIINGGHETRARAR